jgi:hypothetical protein
MQGCEQRTSHRHCGTHAREVAIRAGGATRTRAPTILV